MSTSPENRLINVLSHWLARHVDDVELARELADAHGLSPDQAEAVEELCGALAAGGSRQQLEVVVRETLEALALG